jgi:hypothetical protein
MAQLRATWNEAMFSLIDGKNLNKFASGGFNCALFRLRWRKMHFPVVVVQESLPFKIKLGWTSEVLKLDVDHHHGLMRDVASL